MIEQSCQMAGILGQWASVAGGATLAAVNVAWMALPLKYRQN